MTNPFLHIERETMGEGRTWADMRHRSREEVVHGASVRIRDLGLGVNVLVRGEEVKNHVKEKEYINDKTEGS